MIANILDITRLENGLPIESSPQDLQKAVAGGVDDVRQLAKNARIELELRLMRCVVSCDPELIRRIAENFLWNAIKFSKEGGAVVVGLPNPSMSAPQENVATTFFRTEGVTRGCRCCLALLRELIRP